MNKAYLKNSALLILLMCLFGCVSISWGQDINWDLLNYHLYNPYAFLHHRLGIDIAPAMLQTYFNPLLDIFNYFLIMTQKPVITSFILGAISGITAFFVYKIGLLCFEKRILAFFAVIIGMTGYAGIVQLGSTTNETKTACLLMIAVYCLLKFIVNNKASRKLLIIAGLFAGLTAGFKLTSVPMVLGILGGFVLTSKCSLKNIMILIISIGAGFLISNGYWMWMLYHHFQNPLFPFYNNIFHSSYVEYANYKDARFLPKDMMHFVFLPYYFLRINNLTVEELSMRDPRLAVAFTGIILFFVIKTINFFRKKSGASQAISQEIKFLMSMFIIGYFLWLIQFSIYRYVVVLEIVSGLLIVYFISCVFKKNIGQIIIFIILYGAIQADTHYENWGRVKFKETYFDIYPVVNLPHNALLILSGIDPVAYMVPYIASNRLVVGLNWFMIPSHKNKLQQKENALILNFKGPRYVLSAADNKYHVISQKMLSYYHLAEDTPHCILIHTSAKKVVFCPLKEKESS